jgi:hypothetical protein
MGRTNGKELFQPTLDFFPLAVSGVDRLERVLPAILFVRADLELFQQRRCLQLCGRAVSEACKEVGEQPVNIAVESGFFQFLFEDIRHRVSQL